jgi:hypothetical protein
MLAPRIEYQNHKDTMPEFVALLPGVTPEDFPDGEAAAAEWVRLTTHSGTHLDAPWHFHSTMNKGERSITIDEVPLEWCFQPAVKLDFRDRPDGYVCTASDVERELARIGHRLAPLEIVVNTRAGSRYGSATTSVPVVAWVTRRPCTCSNAASASPAPTPGAGTRRSCTPPGSTARRTTPP